MVLPWACFSSFPDCPQAFFLFSPQNIGILDFIVGGLASEPENLRLLPWRTRQIAVLLIAALPVSELVSLASASGQL